MNDLIDESHIGQCASEKSISKSVKPAQYTTVYLCASQSGFSHLPSIDSPDEIILHFGAPYVNQPFRNEFVSSTFTNSFGGQPPKNMQNNKRDNSEVETEFDKQVEIKRQIPDKKSSIIKKEVRQRQLKRVRYDYEQQLPVIIVPIQVIDLKSRLYMRNIQVQTQNSVPDEIEVMRQEVQLIGGTVRNNRGMGNCLFFAIADQLHRLGVTAATVRRDACQYLLDHMQENIELFDETESIEN
ncbi:MAG: hypothetical protein EZS28_025479, partial [Streblomastix strix]